MSRLTVNYGFFKMDACGSDDFVKREREAFYDMLTRRRESAVSQEGQPQTNNDDAAECTEAGCEEEDPW